MKIVLNDKKKEIFGRGSKLEKVCFFYGWVEVTEIPLTKGKIRNLFVYNLKTISKIFIWQLTQWNIAEVIRFSRGV